MDSVLRKFPLVKMQWNKFHQNFNEKWRIKPLLKHSQIYQTCARAAIFGWESRRCSSLSGSAIQSACDQHSVSIHHCFRSQEPLTHIMTFLPKNSAKQHNGQSLPWDHPMKASLPGNLDVTASHCSRLNTCTMCSCPCKMICNVQILITLSSISSKAKGPAVMTCLFLSSSSVSPGLRTIL